MKAVSKKLLSLLLVAILLVSAVPMQALAAGNTYTLTLNANGIDVYGNPVSGTVGGNTSVTRTVTVGEAVGELPNAEAAGYTFAGWHFVDGSRLHNNDAWAKESDDTLTAIYKLKTNTLTIKAIINDNVSGAQTIYGPVDVAVGTKLLDALDSVKGTIQTTLANDYAGYTWANEYWYDYSGTIPLNSQDQYLSEHQVVCVKLYSNKYTLSFNAGNGTVSPTSKTVEYNKAVGTLPTPTLNGYLFRGWFTEPDGKGNQFATTSIYNVRGNCIAYAYWKQQATVVLEIYLNGNKTEPDRCPVLKTYAAGDKITQQDVEAIVKQYYSANSGSSLTLQGLYDSNTWQNYLANANEAGSPSIEIKDGVNYIYVMVNNAKQGASSTPTTTPTTGSNSGSTGSNSGSNKPADPSNPKTGDDSMIYASMGAMLIAAMMLVVVEQLRKRKMI